MAKKMPPFIAEKIAAKEEVIAPAPKKGAKGKAAAEPAMPAAKGLPFPGAKPFAKKK